MLLVRKPYTFTLIHDFNITAKVVKIVWENNLSFIHFNDITITTILLEFNTYS